MAETKRSASSSEDVSASDVEVSPPDTSKQPIEVSSNTPDTKDKTNLTATAAFATIDDYRYHKPIDEYEGIHRWDPDFYWEDAEEKKLVRKVSQSSNPNILQCTADFVVGLAHLLLLLPHVLRPTTRPRKRRAGPIR